MIPPSRIRDCAVGDIIECPTDKYNLLAIIIGEEIVGRYWRWRVLPFNHPSHKKPFLIKKIATNWKKVA